MSSLQEHLFIQAASRSLAHLTKDLQSHYEPKKGDRFNVKGITYEIGPPKYTDQTIRFEISSKIPGEELPEGYDHARYFREIEKICNKVAKKPEATDMENIVRETRDQERKERDYVKCAYVYAADELYDNEAVLKEVESCSKDSQRAAAVPTAQGVTTLAGRIILNRLEESLYDFAKANIENLISANNAVRTELKKGKK